MSARASGRVLNNYVSFQELSMAEHWAMPAIIISHSWSESFTKKNSSCIRRTSLPQVRLAGALAERGRFQCSSSTSALWFVRVTGPLGASWL